MGPIFPVPSCGGKLVKLVYRFFRRRMAKLSMSLVLLHFSNVPSGAFTLGCCPGRRLHAHGWPSYGLGEALWRGRSAGFGFRLRFHFFRRELLQTSFLPAGLFAAQGLGPGSAMVAMLAPRNQALSGFGQVWLLCPWSCSQFSRHLSDSGQGHVRRCCLSPLGERQMAVGIAEVLSLLALEETNGGDVAAVLPVVR